MLKDNAFHRLTLTFFALSGLDLLDAVDRIPPEVRSGLVDWIYMHQLEPEHGGVLDFLCAVE